MRSPLRRVIALSTGLLLAGSLQAGATELVEAVKRGDAAALQAQIARGADVNQAEPDGTTALHWAAHRGDAEAVRQLLAAGANARVSNRYGVNPLSLASVNGHAGVIQLLLKAGADPNGTAGEGETPLMAAARAGVVEAVQVLIAHGANVDARETSHEQTPLMWAAAEGHAGVIRALAAAGADVKAQSSGGFTPLLFAAREGHIDAVVALLEVGASLDESLSINSAESAGGVAQGRREANLDAFLLAAGNAHFELAALLLDRGANPNAAPRGWTALHQVNWMRKTGDFGSNNPPPQGSGNMTSLEFVRKLVAKGADVNARATVRRLPLGASGLNYLGATPFLVAARAADVALMQLLIELGADPLAANADGTTPLMAAAGVGCSLPGEEPGTDAEAVEAVRTMLKLGDDLNAVDANGNTAMHGAAYKHLPGVARFLGEAGAKIDVWNRKNKAGHTPLAIAAGIQRGMNFVYSRETEAVIRGLLEQAGAVPATQP
jgi:ankyrin repeat protein